MKLTITYMLEKEEKFPDIEFPLRKLHLNLFTVSEIYIIELIVKLITI